MNCDKCGAATRGKQITSKKDGKTYQVFECTGGCMNGNYPYSMFPPRDKASKGGSSAGATNASAGQMAGLLGEILKSLCRIEVILANPGKTHIAPSELKPSDELPEGF